MPDWRDKSNIYVGREFAGLEASPLQNPYRIGKDGDRDGVVAKYRTYIKATLMDSNFNAQQGELWDISASLEEFGEITLWCWCAPESCHAEVIRGILLDT
jgi:hypothetical protein